MLTVIYLCKINLLKYESNEEQDEIILSYIYTFVLFSFV